MYKGNSLANGTHNNRSFRTGCFFYGVELDAAVATQSNEDAYKFKSAVIERTAIDLVGQLRRLAYSKVICVIDMSLQPELPQMEEYVNPTYTSFTSLSVTHQEPISTSVISSPLGSFQGSG